MLAVHERSGAPLVGAPSVVEAAAAAVRAHGSTDANIAWHAAVVVVALNAVQPAAIAKEHGTHGAACVAALSVELAVRAQARGELVPALNGKVWHEMVLAAYPRLRERPARAA